MRPLRGGGEKGRGRRTTGWRVKGAREFIDNVIFALYGDKADERGGGGLVIMRIFKLNYSR